jgi:hypothetical protein
MNKKVRMIAICRYCSRWSLIFPLYLSMCDSLQGLQPSLEVPGIEQLLA